MTNGQTVGDPLVRAIVSSAYTLDGVGNRIRTALNEPMMPSYNAETVNYTYSLGNILNTAGGNTYTHDANGNRTSKTNGTNVTSYTYDSLNRLTQTSTASRQIQYIYNGLGQRVAKIDNGVQVNYLVDPNGILPQVLAETDNTGNLIAYYVYDGVGLVAKVTPQNQYYFYHYDGLGSTVAITNSNGAVVNTYCYSPEGLVGAQETIPNPFTYVGKYGVIAEGNGLYFMRARYYDPEVGRFINKDPIGYWGGLNLFTYTGNNQVSSVDPTGLLMNCVQIRSGDNTTIICIDPSGTQSYNLTEPAGIVLTDPYGENQNLPPGLFQLLPRPPIENKNAKLPTGAPLYTTPGQPAGIIITPSWEIRGDPPAGPHVGTGSKGCPLFPPTKEGKRQQKDFYRHFNANIGNGGTWIIIIDPNVYINR